MTNPHQETYQELYDNTAYASDVTNSPGLKFFPKFEHFIKSPLIDLGCGRGLLVKHIREKYPRRKTDGIDFVDNRDDTLMVGDITKPIKIYGQYRCAVCMDVLEHLEPGQEAGVIDNLAQADRAIASVHSGHSLVRPGGKELHINLKSWDEWQELFEKKMTVIEKIPVSEHQCIFLMEKIKRPYTHHDKQDNV
jgi:hypothetical protein